MIQFDAAAIAALGLLLSGIAAMILAVRRRP
jgi:hypothetical protein